MYRNLNTVDTEFSEFNQARLPKQTRLPEDGQSSFSSLDSDIAVMHREALVSGQKSHRFKYLEDGPKEQNLEARTPRPSQRTIKTPIRKGSPSRTGQKRYPAPRPFPSSLTPVANEDNSRLNELTLQNENYRLEMEALRASNAAIQRQLRLNHDELRLLRNQIKENGQLYHQSFVRQHQLADKDLSDRLKQAERQVSRLFSEKQVLSKRLHNEKGKSQAYQKEISHLQKRIGEFEHQLFEISVKEDKLKHFYAEMEEEHRIRISRLERALKERQQNTVGSAWQDNFIDVVMDMVVRSRQRQGLPPIDEHLPLKKYAKECWRYLKRVVLRQRNQRQPLPE